ncbi:MAG: hypothetical protein JO192_01715 [Candidatus Eremiobacteraeota bacterium]|nr:hypothetical protein [Candidatus Eremiobacteraeota bacterium]
MLQALLVLVWHVPHGTELGSSIVLPLLVTLAYAFVWADAQEAEQSEHSVWERFLERAWAVIVIDFISGEITSAGWVYSLSSETLQIIGGFLAFGLSVLIIFADASATIDDDVTVWTVVPRGFMRSMAVTLNGRTLIRALALFALELLIFAGTSAIYDAFPRLPETARFFWAAVPLSTVTAVPLAALLVLVYGDAKLALANSDTL